MPAMTLAPVLRTFGQAPSGASPPSAPTISAANDGDGSTATITVSGAAGVTAHLRYRLRRAAAWTSGGSRSGNGDIEVTGLTTDARYEFVAYAESGGLYSVPSAPVDLRITDDDDELLVQVAEAVVDELNAAEFDLSFTAVRAYRPVYELKDMGTLHVTVVAVSAVKERYTRAEQQVDLTVDVAVQQKPDPLSDATLDPLRKLTEDIRDLFMGCVIITDPHTVCVARENEPPYSPEHMEQYRQFTSVVRLVFRAIH